MLFYVLTILAIITKHADLLFVVMAWIFVLFAAGCTPIVHVTSNNRPRRAARSSASARWCWLIMWLIFIVRIMLGLP